MAFEILSDQFYRKVQLELSISLDSAELRE